MKRKNVWPGASGRGAATSRWVPTRYFASRGASNATSSNPSSPNHSRISPVRSPVANLPRVQITVAPGVHSCGSAATVARRSSSVTLPKTPHICTRSAGYGAGVAVGGAGVAASYVDGEIVRGGVLLGRPGQARVELEQCRCHPRAVGARRQHLQQVAPVAGAGADHPQTVVVSLVEPLRDLPLHRASAARQVGVRVGVRCVPGLPVGAHATSLGQGTTTHERARTVEELLERRTRIALVPADTELARPAAERALARARGGYLLERVLGLLAGLLDVGLPLVVLALNVLQVLVTGGLADALLRLAAEVVLLVVHLVV